MDSRVRHVALGQAETRRRGGQIVAQKSWQLYIGGQWVGATSGRTFDVLNPATREPIASVPDGGPEEARSAVDAAAVAFMSWSKLPGIERGRILAQAYQL